MMTMAIGDCNQGTGWGSIAFTRSSRIPMTMAQYVALLLEDAFTLPVKKPPSARWKSLS